MVLRLGDPRRLEQLGSLPAADRVEVPLVVGDVLDLEVVELEAEPREVVIRLVQERTGELLAVLIDLLGRQRREHATQVAFKRLARDLHDLLARHRQEALDRVRELHGLARDLDVRDTLNVERDATARVRALNAQLDHHVREVHPIDDLDQRDAQTAAALDDAITDSLVTIARCEATVATGEDQHFVRRADVDDARDDEADQEQRSKDSDGSDKEKVLHDNSFQLRAGGVLPFEDVPVMTFWMSTPRVFVTSSSSLPMVAG